MDHHDQMATLLERALQDCFVSGVIPSRPGPGRRWKIKKTTRGEYFTSLIHQLIVKDSGAPRAVDAPRDVGADASQGGDAQVFERMHPLPEVAAQSSSAPSDDELAAYAAQLGVALQRLADADGDEALRLTVRAEGGFLNIGVREHDSAPATAATTTTTPSIPAGAAGGSSVPSFHFAAIATIHSCFPEKHGCPRQGAKVPTGRGRLVLRPDLSPQLLDGLDQFSHVWLVFVFHNNGDEPLRKTKISAPRLQGDTIGMYASRAPHRVNPIGLTVCRLDRVDGNCLHLSGIDLISGTPILDIKPYHSYAPFLDGQ